jgi:hypothetical protein
MRYQQHSVTAFAPLRLCVSVLLICLTLAVSGRTDVEAVEATQQDSSLRKACEYLWLQQAKDGGWHSRQYAVMRSGQSLTPFVLHSLLKVPDSVCPRPEGAVERALEFIRKHIGENGAIGHADPDIAEYPVYSTAYALMCLGIAGTDDDAALRNRMETFLRSAQFREANGFDRNHPAFGGWGFDAPRRPGDPGHMDLAHTRRVLQALANCAPCVAVMSTIRADAQAFLYIVQKHPTAAASQPLIEGFSATTAEVPFDGGFYFSPVVLAANKGREEFKEANYFRSYATATCDGMLALLAAGVPQGDERVVKAIGWLRAHDDLTHPQGVPIDHSEPWGEAIRFYHYAVRAEAYAALNWPGEWKQQLRKEVVRQQKADGSFRNDVSPLMKEDDPILCTALAVVALKHCLENGGGGDAPVRETGCGVY